MGHHRDETYSKESFLRGKANFVAKILQSPIKASKKKKTATTTTTTTKKQALTFPAKFPLLFNQVMIFPKNREFGSLVVRP